MTGTELFWLCVGLAAGLALSLLLLWLRLSLDLWRLRRRMARHRNRQAVAASAARSVMPAPAIVPIEASRVGPVAAEQPQVEARWAPIEEETAPVEDESLPIEEQPAEPVGPAADELSEDPAPAPEPGQSLAGNPAGASPDYVAEPRAADKPAAPPVSVEDLFADAFRGDASPKAEPAAPLAEWRPAKPRSQPPKD